MDSAGLGPELSIDELTSIEQLGGIRPQWRDLYDRCPWATPFQSPEWVESWLAHVYGGGAIWSLAVRRGSDLVALAPLYIHGTEEDHGARQVSFLGTGVSDYLDIIADPQYAAAAADAVADYLASRADTWQLCDLQELRPDSLLLRTRFPEALGVHIEEGDPCPVVALPETVEAFEGGLNGKFRKHLRYYLRRLSERAEVRFEEAAPATLGELLDALLRLHQARWQERGELGVLAYEPLQQFHREVAASLLAKGELHMHALRAGGEIVAVAYGFVTHGRVYYYLGGFDPEWESFSVGSLIVRHSIEAAIRKGAREYDFLRKGETYKYRWGAQDRVNRRLVLSPAWRLQRTA
jgi:CelD/BcsL family acetyltransferase involved in cellulose biosynthesis